LNLLQQVWTANILDQLQKNCIIIKQKGMFLDQSQMDKKEQEKDFQNWKSHHGTPKTVYATWI
jgi:hypothetical protein